VRPRDGGQPEAGRPSGPSRAVIEQAGCPPRPKASLLRGSLWIAAVLLAPALSSCLTQPSDEEQIRSVARRSVEAISRGDLHAVYRMTDLDFRAVCPRDRYEQALHAGWDAARPVRVASIDAITIRGVRAAADLTLVDADGTRTVRRQFVKDGGRWYLYEDEDGCRVPGAECRVPGAGCRVPGAEYRVLGAA
jgi:hypothetical protein